MVAYRLERPGSLSDPAIWNILVYRAGLQEEPQNGLRYLLELKVLRQAHDDSISHYPHVTTYHLGSDWLHPYIGLIFDTWT